MRLGEIVTRLNVDTRKLTEYALNPDHPRGRHKARRLREALGFSQETVGQLVAQIEALALDGEAIAASTDNFGQRVTVDLDIVGVEGQTATVRTGWLVAADSDTARLVTLFVRRSK